MKVAVYEGIRDLRVQTLLARCSSMTSQQGLSGNCVKTKP